MESLIIIITGLIAGFILGKAVSILHYTIKIKQERRKNMIEIVKTHKATKKEILDFIQSLPKEEQRAAYRAAVIMGQL